MAYLTNMRETCRKGATRPEHALDLLTSIRDEFDQGLNGGIFDATYVLSKLDSLTRHVKWLEAKAKEEFASQVEG